ncbi:MAG TPA: hypothetical protein PLR35_01345 [Burkholderiaceae bacterium]|jgi:hypothetical protein|nr:hypothetical protein [Burkholderiaceae bacterium]
MQQLVASGRIVDLILVLVAVELAVFGYMRARRGRGIAWHALLPNLLAGAALLLALRAAITGAAWPWIAAWLAAAGLAHVADLRVRWDGRH